MPPRGMRSSSAHPHSPAAARAAAGLCVVVGLLAAAGPTCADEPSEDERAMGRRLQEALRAQRGEIHRCYGVALDRDRQAAGELLVQVHLGAGGQVARAEVLKDQTVHAAGLSECLQKSIAGWSLPQLQAQAGDRVVFPLVFRTDDLQPGPVVVPPAQARDAFGPQRPQGVDVRDYITAISHPGTQAGLSRVRLEAGTRLGQPQEPDRESAIYVLSGRGTLRGAGSGPQGTEPVGPGDAVWVGPGADYALGATTQMELICVSVPPGPVIRKRAAAHEPPAPGAASVRLLRGDKTPRTTVMGGRGTAQVLWPPAPGPTEIAAGAGRLSLSELTLGAGAELPAHDHPGVDEVLYIVSGQARMKLGSRGEFTVGPGDAVRLPPGQTHSVAVRERLRAIQSYSPAGPEARLRPSAKPEKKP